MVSYVTAEHMLNRAEVTKGQTVLVTGASGGVGSAVLQLAKRRGVQIIGIASRDKADQARETGADHVIFRGNPIRDELNNINQTPIDVVVDVVVGGNR